MRFSSPKEKAQALENSAPLNVHRWSAYPEVNAAVDALYGELEREGGLVGRTEIKKRHIKVIILDLWANWLIDRKRYVAYSRRRNSYFAQSRYNAIHLSSTTIAVVDALRQRGYVEHHRGFPGRGFKDGRMSRMRATEKLIGLIEGTYRVPRKAIQRHPDTECIILRDHRKKNIEYPDTEETCRMRHVVTAYNACLATADIRLPSAPAGVLDISGKPTKIDIFDTFVRRIFNNATWDDGGRFYGGWWQRIPSDRRIQIAINGSQNGSIELDYSGHHVTLLYAQQGIDYWREDRSDPYKLEGWERSERMRALLKLVLLVAINSRDKKSALAAIRRKINFHQDDYGWVNKATVPLGNLIDAFGRRHAPIQHCFYSSAGVRLQRLDSDLAEIVVSHFTRKQIPVLCIHDSFVIHPEHEEELKQVMKEALKSATFSLSGGGLAIEPKITRKPPLQMPLPPAEGKASETEPAWMKLPTSARAQHPVLAIS
jgi:hypothetical protein